MKLLSFYMHTQIFPLLVLLMTLAISFKGISSLPAISPNASTVRDFLPGPQTVAAASIASDVSGFAFCTEQSRCADRPKFRKWIGRSYQNPELMRPMLYLLQ